MRIERADCDGNARPQTGFLRPRGRKSANGAVNRMDARREARTKLAELRIEFGKELRIGIPAPLCVPHRLVAGGANAGDESGPDAPCR